MSFLDNLTFLPQWLSICSYNDLIFLGNSIDLLRMNFEYDLELSNYDTISEFQFKTFIFREIMSFLDNLTFPPQWLSICSYFPAPLTQNWTSHFCNSYFWNLHQKLHNISKNHSSVTQIANFYFSKYCIHRNPHLLNDANHFIQFSLAHFPFCINKVLIYYVLFYVLSELNDYNMVVFLISSEIHINWSKLRKRKLQIVTKIRK